MTAPTNWVSGVSGVSTIGVAALLSLASAVCSAQAYPNRPITFIAPYAAGGDSDLAGRNLAATAAKFMGQTIVVQNIVGASGTIGSMRVRTAAPDGYTLLIARGGSQAIMVERPFWKDRPSPVNVTPALAWLQPPLPETRPSASKSRVTWTAGPTRLI